MAVMATAPSVLRHALRATIARIALTAAPRPGRNYMMILTCEPGTPTSRSSSPAWPLPGPPGDGLLSARHRAIQDHLHPVLLGQESLDVALPTLVADVGQAMTGR